LLKNAHHRGTAAALQRFKLAGPMGADVGVMPKGDEQSHGTDRVQYARRDPTSVPNGQDPNMSAWLWDNFTTYDNIAPGRADGTFGQETIG
jgi:hypothetical protein